ncbi:Ribonuclease T2-like 1-A [Lachnellula cervina]|uniref:ribonuclease T2 n=1 Tax=Lachnellula cervina TaxID=1316786 RepID=A0A7D8YUL9_9HELO|nr:Ribonuclease T2-like 1-A [Lachnellula cervina]
MQLLTATAVSSMLVGVSQALLYPGQSNLNHTCQLQTPFLSCSANAYPNITDSCCTETYGGLVLSTQLWNTYTGLESQGQLLPKNSWSLHGLWPDFCNGSYTQYCDLSISTFLAPFGKFDLLAYMNKFWIAQAQPNSDFWGHEFSKHGTCYSTFDLPCYGPQYRQHEEVVDFFETAISYYETLPTWIWLGAQGIYPSNSTTYSLTDFQSALAKGFGALPYIACSGPKYNATAAGNGTLDNGGTVLSEVWYYHHVLGRVQARQGTPVNASINGGSLGNCAKAKGALRYPVRTVGSEV